jgi:hypothetical protein
MLSAMRTQILVAVLGVLFGCGSKKSDSTSDQPATAAAKPDTRPTAPLVDLTASSTLAPVRAVFNAKKGEARFLTLLSPT